ncbi:hypothetical protein S7S_05210 [Isoalcanivorax pacificus W11-5]|uniref:Outer membrane protein n=1 Tax=Isoalcanivorax pacificus W11-5 TaxID=391936 RepID=A0A0B4XMC0_9GAMM|nr:lipid A deacylase LpxR family protein [Isoalcanivorax pacificus]AJD47462.1 hypothetical protein S7S_05210 [Isoalcanivorax pacificus W11-5]
MYRPFFPALLILTLWPALYAGSVAAQSQEAWNTGWALYVDNDVLTPRSTDRDYTGGFSLTLSGRRAAEWPLSLQPLLGGINHLLLPATRGSGQVLHSLETGLTVFTPEDIEQESARHEDRPYASLLYVSNTAQHVEPWRDVAWTTTLTLGVLGLDLVADLQDSFHRVIGSTEPKGWDNQISHGGELTARYSLARQQKVFDGGWGNGLNHETTHTLRTSVGYITDVSWGMATRVGLLRTPWWSFNPQLVEYAEKSVPVKRANTSELYLWGGFQIKARLYNAFLQGQFRDSEVTYARDELETFVLETWLGITQQFRSGLRLSYVLRGQTREISEGPASRNSIWGGVIISRAF